jgi:hypothetical protein
MNQKKHARCADSAQQKRRLVPVTDGLCGDALRATNYETESVLQKENHD